MRLRDPGVRFLGSQESTTPAAVLIGAPLDLTESFRAGTSAAPDRIRLVSDVLETYSPTLHADLAERPPADWGNVDLVGRDMVAALSAVAAAMREAASVALPIMLGGEHTATVGAIRGLADLYPGLTVIAHADLRDDYEGVQLSHATVMRRIADVIGFERIAQYGVRSGTREEFELARRCLHSGPDLTLTRTVRDRIHTRPVYLTIDVDVLDPACAPGTGCPEPGGASFAEILAFVHALQGLNVVALDVMEVLPAADVNDITSVAAAKLVREAALLFSKPRGGKP